MVVFFFNDTATTEIYTLSLHDALPISVPEVLAGQQPVRPAAIAVAGGAGRTVCHQVGRGGGELGRDRKSTRLNSSHANISYAVFCLKKKRKHTRGTN